MLLKRGISNADARGAANIRRVSFIANWTGVSDLSFIACRNLVNSSQDEVNLNMNHQEYDKLSASEQQAYDASQRKKEAQEQAALPYKWTQDLDHASLTYEIPGGETIRAKQLDVSINRRGLKVSRKDNKETLLEGEFPNEVKVDDSTWSLGEF